MSERHSLYCENAAPFVDYKIFFALDKDNCRTCEIVLKKIETIDDDCDALGIEMVKVKDPVFAKR